MNRATCNMRECTYMVHKAGGKQEAVDKWKSVKVHIIMLSLVADNMYKYTYMVYKVDNQHETCV